ncbi:IS5 family transposase [Streptomyces sp. NPDC006516]|uniref:IS5 family transposase n=1 Tax=Streptomyces sp. NPDC006516 TaxID=3154309 RepID=UPI0033A60561
MGRGDLSDEEWTRLELHLPTNRGRGGRWQCHRRVINGILFRQRTGLPWWDLPSRFGRWKTVHDRHRRWSADGTGSVSCAPSRSTPMRKAASTGHGRRRLHALPRSSARGWRLHSCPEDPRPPKQTGTHRSDEALGRSRGGLTCKIHLVGDGGCRPLGFVITPGQ